MRGLLGVLFKFLIATVCSLAAIAACDFLISSARESKVLFGGTSVNLDFPQLLIILQRDALWAIIVAWFITAVGLVQRDVISRLSLLMLGLVSAAAIFGAFLLNKVQLQSAASTPSRGIETFEGAGIVSAKDGYLIPSGTGVWYVSKETEGKRVLLKDVKIDEVSQTVTAPGLARVWPFSALEGTRRTIMQEDPLVDPVMAFLTSLGVDLTTSLHGDLVDSLLLSIAFAISLSSLWVFLRLTRWPLLNIILGIAGAFGYLVLVHIGAGEQGARFFSFLPGALQRYLSPILLALPAALLLLCLIFMPKLEDWHREVNE